MEEFMQLPNLLQCLEVRAAYYIMQVSKGIKDANTEEKVWMNELIAIDIDKMARAHLIYLMYQLSVEVLSQHKFKDANIGRVLNLVCQLFAIKQLKDNHAALYEVGFFGPGSVELIERAFKKLLVDLRPHMLGLVEWFSVGDTTPSVIGNKYGDIYEAQLETAMKSKLNTGEPPSFYHKYMKPTMTMYKPKL
jgi:hypothetical protein